MAEPTKAPAPLPPPPPGAPPNLVFDAELARLAIASPDDLNKDPSRYQQIGQGQTTIMVGPDGKQWNIPANEAQPLLAQGYAFLPHEQAAKEVRLDAKKGGAGGAFTRGLLDPTGAIGETVQREAAAGNEGAEAIMRGNAEHPYAHGAGTALGAAGTALATGGTSAATRGLGLGAKAAIGALEGGIYAAPTALVHASYGDTEHAAESLLWGVGIGGALGLGSGALSKAARSAEEATMRQGIKHGLLDETGTLLKAPRAAGEAVPQDIASWMAAREAGAGKTQVQALLEEHVPGLAQKAATKGLGEVGGMLGNAAMGPYGGIVGQRISSAIAERVLGNSVSDLATRGLKRLADNPETLQYFGRALANGAASTAAERIAGTAASLLTREAVAADPLKQLLGPSANGLSKTQQWDRVERAFSQADTGAEIGHMGSMFGMDPELKAAIARKQEQTVDYLRDSMPKRPTPQPFDRREWAPTDAEKKAFVDRLEVAQNPWSVLQRAANGTLNGNHVEALKTIYPTFHAQMVAQIGQMAYDPKAPIPAPGVRAALSQLTGVNLTNPTGINFQGAYPPPAPEQHGPPPPKGKGPGSSRASLKDTPSLATQTAHLEFKGAKL